MHLTSKQNSNLPFDKRRTRYIECLCPRNKRPQNAYKAQRQTKFCGICIFHKISFVRFFLTVLVTWHAFIQKKKQHFTFRHVFRRHKTKKCGVTSFYANNTTTTRTKACNSLTIPVLIDACARGVRITEGYWTPLSILATDCTVIKTSWPALSIANLFWSHKLNARLTKNDIALPKTVGFKSWSSRWRRSLVCVHC